VRSAGAILGVLGVLRSRYRLSAEVLLQVSLTGSHHTPIGKLKRKSTVAAAHLLNLCSYEVHVECRQHAQQQG